MKNLVNIEIAKNLKKLRFIDRCDYYFESDNIIKYVPDLNIENYQMSEVTYVPDNQTVIEWIFNTYIDISKSYDIFKTLYELLSANKFLLLNEFVCRLEALLELHGIIINVHTNLTPKLSFSSSIVVLNNKDFSKTKQIYHSGLHYLNNAYQVKTFNISLEAKKAAIPKCLEIIQHENTIVA